MSTRFCFLIKRRRTFETAVAHNLLFAIAVLLGRAANLFVFISNFYVPRISRYFRGEKIDAIQLTTISTRNCSIKQCLKQHFIKTPSDYRVTKILRTVKLKTVVKCVWHQSYAFGLIVVCLLVCLKCRPIYKFLYNDQSGNADSYQLGTSTQQHRQW